MLAVSTLVVLVTISASSALFGAWIKSRLSEFRLRQVLVGASLFMLLTFSMTYATTFAPAVDDVQRMAIFAEQWDAQDKFIRASGSDDLVVEPITMTTNLETATTDRDHLVNKTLAWYCDLSKIAVVGD